MALSQRTKDIMIVALADKKAGEELASAVESGGNTPAEEVEALGAITAVGTTDGVANDAAVATDVDAAVADLQAKIDEVIAALKAAGLMES